MSVGTRLLKDHVDIESELRELEHACEGADAPTLQRIWAHFEQHLEDHLRGEELFLFPALQEDHGPMVERARTEHHAIRRSLEELGMAVELHSVRKERIDVLLRQLRAHSAWEDLELYPRAEPMLGSGIRARLMALLGRLGQAAA